MATIPQMFCSVTDRYSSEQRAAYLHKCNGRYIGITYSQLRRDVEAYAAALDSLGLESGDRIVIVSENCYEWVLTDFATLLAGGVDVPVFPTLTAKQIAYIVNHSQATLAAVSSRFQLDKLISLSDELETLEGIVVFDDLDGQMTVGSSTGRSIPVYSIRQLIERGEMLLSERDREHFVAECLARSRPDDLCTIIYTSGTTGVPKGVMLTHRNILSNVEAARQVIEVGSSDVFLSYLPMCHSYERTTGFYIAFASGATTAFAESLDTVRTNLQEVRPTLMTSVPQLFERMRAGLHARMSNQSPMKRRLFQWAVGIGMRRIAEIERGTSSLLTELSYRIADRLVFRKIRHAVGGRLRFFVSGGGALPEDTNRFFWAIGLPILEGYGLTEASPVLTVNRLDDNEFGTVGKPLPGIEIRIADGGEILARGPNIMRGYWRDPTATAEAIDSDGWLHTGDIGQWTAKGNLKITDRIKNLIVTSGGKNVAPQAVESALGKLSFIRSVVVVGDGRPYCAAIIVPDEDVLRTIAQANGLDAERPLTDLCNDTKLIGILQREVEHAQRDLAKYERVRRFALIPEPFTVENGLLTPTLKPKRNEIIKRYAAVIEQLYTVGE
jgi:long-chain acyl-CoA synthetase